MNDLQTTVNKTMSSREIAELTGKEHRHVLRDIEVMLKELDLNKEGYAQTWAHPQNGQTYPEYLLDRELTEVLLTGYSAVLRRKVIARWRELEAQAAKPAFVLPDFTNPAIAARAWADQVDKVQALAIESQTQQATIAAQAPKVEALDRIATADGSMCITNAAKALQCQPKRLFAHLQACQWIYRRAGGNGYVGYQDKIQQGLLDHKVTTVERSDGSSKMVEQVLVTPKGLTKLATLLAVN